MKCCICGKEFIGHGNNPQPIKRKGICCDECNMMIVIPERVYRFTKRRKSNGNRNSNQKTRSKVK